MSFLQNANLQNSTCVKVAVRMRPFNKRETDTKACITIDNNTVLIKNLQDNKVKKFSYDYAYGMDSSQQNVANDIGNKVIDNAFNGYNACVFAYGQTGSGKSHTMMGSPGDPGLIPKICEELFNKQRIHNNVDIHSASITYRVELSYLEIYAESVIDLLTTNANLTNANLTNANLTNANLTNNGKSADSKISKFNQGNTNFVMLNNKSLKVREHPELGPYVESLTQIPVTDLNSIKKLIDQGNAQRHTASTLMNSKSSRSHAILTLYFTQIIEELSTTRTVVSRINLVDLAGSEKAEASGVTGIQFKEAININKSLSNLGNVIGKLVTASKSPNDLKHIPFRDSVLTWILKDSLGGNSCTYMLATVSPSDINYAESLSTLRYAESAKKIVNIVKINEDSNVKLVQTLKNEIAQLTKQLMLKNADLSTPTAELTKLKEELAQREELIKEKEKTWEQKLQASQQLYKTINEQLKQELLDKSAEYLSKLESMDAEKSLLLEELTLLKNQVSNTDVESKEKTQEDIDAQIANQLATFEKNRIIETAVSLHTYYDEKLAEIQLKYNNEINEVKNKNNELINAELSKLQALLTEKTKSLDDCNTALANNQREIADKTKSLDDCNTALTTCQQELTSCKKQLQYFKELSDTMSKTAQTTKLVLNAQIASLQNKLANV